MNDLNEKNATISFGRVILAYIIYKHMYLYMSGYICYLFAFVYMAQQT